ncbi:F-box only protein 2 [Formica fusca]
MARYSRWFAIGLPRGGDRELSKITFAVFLALAGYELEPFSTESQRTVLCATIATISTIVRDTDTITKIFCHSDHLIDLEIKGFHSCVLDCLQPPITVEKYYLYDPDYPIIYECHIELLGEKGNLIDTFHFCDTIRDNKQWIYVSHTFKNYGPGLTRRRHGLRNSVWDQPSCGGSVPLGCKYITVIGRTIQPIPRKSVLKFSK